jgi:hypothetical protein
MDSTSDFILEYLFIGSKDTLEDISKYVPFHFIVNCTVNIPFPKYPMPLQLRIPVEDDIEDNIKFIEMMVYTNVLEKMYKCICQQQNVLVYSNYGQQRSCALVACFLIKYLKLRPRQAIRFVSSKRKNAFQSDIPNNRFENTIHFYYEYLQLKKENKQTNNNNCQKIDEKKKRLEPRIQPI